MNDATARLVNTTPSSRPLTAVIVGCGGFSRNYLPVYRSLPDVRVLTCVDADLAAAQSMANTLGAERASQDIADAVGTDADFAVVSTPKAVRERRPPAVAALDGLWDNAIAPGPLDTEGFRAAGGNPEKRAGTIPTRRMISPEEVAAACLFLADPIQSLTGQTLIVDGGSHAAGCYV